MSIVVYSFINFTTPRHSDHSLYKYTVAFSVTWIWPS